MPKTDLNPRQRRAISALMTCPTLAAAAREAKVSERQLYRWLYDEPVFQKALRTAQDEALSSTVRNLAAMGTEAAETLRAQLSSNDATPGVKVRAGDVILSQMARLSELADLEARIAALEQGAKHGNA